MKQSIPILTVLVVIGTSAFAQQQAPNWLKVTGRAAWEPRDSQGEVVYKDQLWIFGGGSYLPNYHAVNDVWCTEDGLHWIEVTDAAPWHPRLWFASVVYRDRMRVLGGWWNNPSKNWGDVWYSEDGENWDELKSNVTWKERHEHSAFVFRENIWIAGGHARPLSNEVWSLDIPKGWFQKIGESISVALVGRKVSPRSSTSRCGNGGLSRDAEQLHRRDPKTRIRKAISRPCVHVFSRSPCVAGYHLDSEQQDSSTAKWPSAHIRAHSFKMSVAFPSSPAASKVNTFSSNRR